MPTILAFCAKEAYFNDFIMGHTGEHIVIFKHIFIIIIFHKMSG